METLSWTWLTKQFNGMRKTKLLQSIYSGRDSRQPVNDLNQQRRLFRPQTLSWIYQRSLDCLEADRDQRDYDGC